MFRVRLWSRRASRYLVQGFGAECSAKLHAETEDAINAVCAGVAKLLVVGRRELSQNII